MSGWIGAVTNGGLFKSGGLFQLTTEVDYGTNFGLKSLYFKSRASAVANSGVVRMGNTDSIVYAGVSNGDVGLTVTYGNAIQCNTGFDAAGNPISNVASPTSNTQAATKVYVDTAIANSEPVPGYTNVGIVTADTSINCAANVYQDLMLAANVTLTFSNADAVGKATSITLYVRQSANGGNTITWGNTVRWSDNITPVLSTAANTADMFTFLSFNNGSIWFGVQAMGNVPAADVW